MTKDYTYKDYVTAKTFCKDYSVYQKKYAVTPRESDKVIFSQVKQVMEILGNEALHVLDMGCSTGNLLLHLKNLYPRLKLTGGDLMISVIEDCRQNPDLAGIEFLVLDIFDIPASARYDCIIVNAVLYLFSDDELQRIVMSLSGALKPGGTLILYDFSHGFHQNITIKEKSFSHPEGLTLHYRPHTVWHRALEGAGFTAVDIHPFRIPIELPRREDIDSTREESLLSYTVRSREGENLLFRGALFQPWSHIIARKGR